MRFFATVAIGAVAPLWQIRRVRSSADTRRVPLVGAGGYIGRAAWRLAPDANAKLLGLARNAGACDA